MFNHAERRLGQAIRPATPTSSTGSRAPITYGKWWENWRRRRRHHCTAATTFNNMEFRYWNSEKVSYFHKVICCGWLARHCFCCWLVGWLTDGTQSSALSSTQEAASGRNTRIIREACVVSAAAAAAARACVLPAKRGSGVRWLVLRVKVTKLHLWHREVWWC